jgi:hypothetical protein
MPLVHIQASCVQAKKSGRKMNDKQINEIFEFMRVSTPLARQNIRTLYLERIGEQIIDYCFVFYQNESKAESWAIETWNRIK